MDNFTWPPKDLRMYINGYMYQRWLAPMPKGVKHPRYRAVEKDGPSDGGDPETVESLRLPQGDSELEVTGDLPSDPEVLQADGSSSRRGKSKQKRGGLNAKRNRRHIKGRHK